MPQKVEQVKNTYVLGRTCLSSIRLTSQHFLWREQLGWRLHPDAANHLAKCEKNGQAMVADVACGNGIWMLDEMSLHSERTQFHGFDISAAQFPNRKTLPANAFFDVLDCYQSVPAKYRGKFDVVHCRLVTGAIRNGNISPFLNTFLELLKPGGVLQWDDVDSRNTTPFPTQPGSFEWNGYIANLVQRTRPQWEMDFSWIERLAKTLIKRGMEHVVEMKAGEPKRELRRFWTDNELATIHEIAVALGAGQDVFEDLELMRSSEVDMQSEIRIVVGKKPRTC